MVALSGGVDSATTAWLLQQRGERIETMFMKNWEGDDQTDGCTAEQDASDARDVANQLGLPFHARNFATEYWENVFEQFLAELALGRTPNPDILCNREIKFKAFLEHALALGADCIATGHYARVSIDADGTAHLLKGIDPDKDQSYFLHALDQHQLQKARFPLGEMTKAKVREFASKAKLPVAKKKDSTGICFIGERRFETFIDHYLKATPGPIFSTDGQRVGTHSGLIHYTLGQRKGLSIGGLKDYPEAPWFVAHKDLKTNSLWVCQDTHHPTLMADRLWAEQTHWISGQAPSATHAITAKIRYRQADQKCTVVCDDKGQVEVIFNELQRAVTPGQSVVFYDQEVCLGGAVISHANVATPQGLSSYHPSVA